MKIKLTNSGFLFKRKHLVFMMKTFIFLFCATVFGFTSNNVVSQNSKVKIEEDKVLTVDEVFKIIKNQTDYKFIYEEGIFKDFPKVEVKKGIISTNALLNKSLSGGYLNIIVTRDNTIIIKNDKPEQQIQVSGKVTDMAGQPVPGVTVLIKGTTQGTITNFDGSYSVKVPSPENVLVFSALGFKTLEVTVGNQIFINPILQEQVSELDEVFVVSTGYQTSIRKKVTGNISAVSQKQIENRITTDVTSRLEGTVSGLLLSNETEGEPTITLGGITTFSTDKEPLIVVDGFPISGGINSINPNDIASISVLKDAAASAIWGTKSSNGVIVITTKAGSKADNGDFNISYSSDLIMGEKPSFGFLNQASASDMIDFRQELLDLGLYTSYQFNVRPNGSSLWIDPFDDAYVKLNGAPIAGLAPTWNQSQFDARINELRQVDRLSEIRKHLYRTTFTQRHNLSFSSGTETNQFFFSALYQENPSKNVGNDKNTYSFNLKDYLQVTDKLGLELGTAVLFTEGNQNNTFGDNLVLATDNFSLGGLYPGATGSMIDINGNLIPTGGVVSQSQVGFYNNLGYVKSTTNPIEQIRENDNTFKNVNQRLRAKLDYDILPWLNASLAYSYERINNTQKKLQTADNYAVRKLKFQFTSLKPDNSLLESFPAGGILAESKTLITTKILRGQLNIDKSIGENHNITAVLGIETRAFDLEGREDIYYGYDDRTLLFDTNLDLPGWANNGRPSYFGGGSLSRYQFQPQSISINQEREASYYANAVYNFKDKYILSSSVRMDQANLFGAAKKFQYAPLWSSGLAWNMHNEPFFNLPWVTTLKPRFSMGYNARADRNTTSDLVLRANAFFRDWSYDARPFLGIGTRPNPLLTWEKTFTTNAGVDFSLFNRGRLSGSIDYYNKKSEDLIVQQLTNLTYGFSSITTNNGAIRNNGIEVNLTGKIIDQPDFGWTSNLIYAHNKSEVLSVKLPLTEPRFIVEQNPLNSTLSRGAQQGYPIDAVFSWKYAGLDATGAPQVFVDPTDPNSAIANFSQTSKLTVGSLVHSGQLTPKHFGGFINTFSYKNFTLTTSMSYKFGHIFRVPSFNYNGAVGFGVTTNNIADRWQQPGDENNTDVPGLGALKNYFSFQRNNVANLYAFSDKTIEKADNIRLNNISLSYNIPVKKLGISHLFNDFSITSQINNLGLLWKATDLNFDPEFVGKNAYRGIDIVDEPFPLRLQPGKEIILGIRANF